MQFFKLKPINEGFLAYLNGAEDLNRNVMSKLLETIEVLASKWSTRIHYCAKKDGNSLEHFQAEIFKITDDDTIWKMVRRKEGLEIIQITKFNKT